MLATALQIIRADELFYWITPRLERGIATITGAPPGPSSSPSTRFLLTHCDIMHGQDAQSNISRVGAYTRLGRQTQASWAAVL